MGLNESKSKISENAMSQYEENITERQRRKFYGSEKKPKNNNGDDFNSIEIPASTLNSRRDEFQKYTKTHSTIDTIEERNIVIFGRAKVGKTVIREILKDPVYECPKFSLFNQNDSSEKCWPDYESISVAQGENGIIKLNLLELPGFDKFESVEQERVLNLLEMCYKHHFEYINTLILCIAYEIGVLPSDLIFIEKVIRECTHQSLQIIICVTRSENKTLDQQKSIESDLLHHEFFHSLLNAPSSDLVKSPTCKVLFTGCLSKEFLGSCTDTQLLDNTYKRIANMRSLLLSQLITVPTSVPLIDLPVAEKIKISLLHTLDTIKYIVVQSEHARRNSQQMANSNSLEDIKLLIQSILPYKYVIKFSQLEFIFYDTCERVLAEYPPLSPLLSHQSPKHSPKSIDISRWKSKDKNRVKVPINNNNNNNATKKKKSFFSKKN